MDEGKRPGIILALLTAIVSGVSVFVNGVTVKNFDPFLFTTLKGILVAVFLSSILVLLGQINEIRSLTRKQWKSLFLIGLIGGSVPFMLFFRGLSIGNSSASSFIFRIVFIFAAIISFIYLKEKIDAKFVAGASIILLANFILIKGDLEFGFGQLLVLAATLLWAGEYTYSRKIMQESGLSPRIVAWGRMFFGSAILITLLCFMGKFSLIETTSAIQWQGVLITSLFLFAFVSTWYTALKHIEVATATAILALGGPITSVLNLVILGKQLPMIEIASIPLILAGVAIIIGLRRIWENLAALAAKVTGNFSAE